MGYPTEVGSEHERLRAYPRVGIHLTHMVIYYLGKTAYVICLLCLCKWVKSVKNGVFWGVLFGFFGDFVKKHWGIFFIWTLHMLCGIY